MTIARILIPPAAWLLLGAAGFADAQGFERWFQVELTIFSNEASAGRDRENWRAGQQPLAYPPGMVRLRQLTDFLFLNPFKAVDSAAASESVPESRLTIPDLARLADTGPFPLRESGGFRLPDFQREPFVALSASQSDFRQTNQAIDRAPQYRILRHALWRQPVGDAGAATPVLATGGREYGAQRELQGSVALEFNANRDRVVLSTDLWLAEFGAGGDGQWMLPRLPGEFAGDDASGETPAIRRIYTMRQQRELRSGEFHYLDHPAFGIVVQITPYEVPP